MYVCMYVCIYHLREPLAPETATQFTVNSGFEYVGADLPCCYNDGGEGAPARWGLCRASAI